MQINLKEDLAPKVKVQKVQSEGEVILATALRALKIEFEQEFKFHPTRKWRADFHLKGKKVLIEVEGGSGIMADIHEVRGI